MSTSNLTFMRFPKGGRQTNRTKNTGTPLSKRQAAAFRAYRKAAGYTQQQVADFLGYKTHRAIVAWEAGSWLPRVDTAVRLAELYGCDVGNLLNPP